MNAREQVIRQPVPESRLWMDQHAIGATCGLKCGIIA
jgi:hypothetical protein